MIPISKGVRGEKIITTMMIKDEHGEMHNVASNSKANAGLTTGIIGTALSGLGWLGGLGNGFGRSGAVATSEADEISKLRMENAILNADNATDKKLVDVYKDLASRDTAARDRLDAVKEELSGKIAAEREARLIAEGKQSVLNTQFQTGIDVLASQQKSMAATLANITTTVIPQNKVCDTGCNCGNN